MDLIVTASLLVHAPGTWAEVMVMLLKRIRLSSATPHVVDMGLLRHHWVQVGVLQPTQPPVASRTLLLSGFLHTSELLGSKVLAVGLQSSHDDLSHTWRTLLHHLQRVCPACPMCYTLGPGCTAKSQPTCHKGNYDCSQAPQIGEIFRI